MEVRRNPLKRYYGRGDLHFVTFSCYRRRRYLGSVRARNRFVKILNEVRLRYGFELVGYVVMPEHVHLLVSEPSKGNPSKALQVLKQRVSRTQRRKKHGLKNQMEFRFDGEEEEASAFWQGRFYDLKCLGRKEVKAEAGLYAPESRGSRTSEVPEGVAVEQLGFL